MLKYSIVYPKPSYSLTSFFSMLYFNCISYVILAALEMGIHYMIDSSIILLSQSISIGLNLF